MFLRNEEKMKILLNEYPTDLEKNQFVAIDTEIFQLDPHTLHRPTSGKFGCMTVATDPDTVYIIDDPANVPVMLSKLKDCIWVFHNAKFDLTHLRRWANIEPRSRLWCTLLMDRILWGGYYDRFSLKDLARRYLNIELEKDIREDFEDAFELDKEMIEYAALDASVTLQVCFAQQSHLNRTSFDIWKKIDRPTTWAVLDFMGFRMNVERWEEMAEENKAKADEIEEGLDFNPRSYPQVKTALREAGFKGLPSTGEGVLMQYMAKYPGTKAHELARDVLACRKFSRKASTYGKKFIERHVETERETNTVFGDYRIIGAETGRMSCGSPNLQNIPVRETPEFRKCFIARPGNSIIVADYSAQEPRISAYLSQDKRMIEILNSGKDIYIEVAYIIFGEEITKEDPRRAVMKSLILGTNYGMSPEGLAERENISLKESESLTNKYMHEFPGFASWVHIQLRKKKFVTTVAGRTIWLNPYSDQVARNALNAPVQGSAADMTKAALSAIHKNWKFDYPFACVGAIHDELVFDVPEGIAEEVAEFVKYHMIAEAEKMCPGIKFKADTKIGDSWAVKE